MNGIASLLLGVWLAANPALRFQQPIEKEARELLVYFNAGNFQAASKDFSEAMRQTVTPQVLAAMKKQVDEKLGDFLSIKDLRQRRVDGVRAVELLAQYTKGQAVVRVQFDPTDRVAAIFIDPVAAAAADPARERIARDLLANVTGGRFDAASKDFDAALRGQLTAANLAKLAGDLKASYGLFRSVVDVREAFDGGFNRIDLTADYERRRVVVSVVFDAAGKVSGLKITPAGP